MRDSNESKETKEYKDGEDSLNSLDSLDSSPVYTLTMDKKEFRLAIVGRLKHMTQQERDVQSRVLCRYLKELLGDEPKTIAAYMPYLDEPDIKPLLMELMSKGWTIVMPAVVRNHLVFRIVTDLSQNVRNPVSNILEASDECPAADESMILEAIVPGRAFTDSGLRMGRGNGGYDYWIAAQRKRQPNTRFIGVCFDCQFVPDLPMEAHDQPVDCIVTSRGALQAKKPGKAS